MRIFSSFCSENYSDVYKCQFKLARYFQTTKDKWLSDHFFNSCLRTSAGVKDDDGKMAAEGHCNVGLALEENGTFRSQFCITSSHILAISKAGFVVFKGQKPCPEH